ncbi:hypothetical protein FRC10_002197 [Ceratobasidium sp. 414]|nr:hypothetical protein FRC10_002197 [Ceratobasidium sp. 414]
MPPAIPERIACASVRDLRHALDPLRPLTEQPETEENWEKISRAIQTIGALTRGGATDLDVEYVKEIRSFSGMLLTSHAKQLSEQMNSERTRLANVAVDLLTTIAPPLGNKFEPLIPLFVPTLIKLLGRTNKVFLSRATAGLQSIISSCPHPRILVELRIMATDKSAGLRVIVAGAILQCLSEWDWSVSSFAAKVGEIESFIRSTGTDSNVEVRKIARKTFDLYKQMFPDRVDEFLEPLTPVIKRYLDIKPKAGGGPASRKPAPVPAPRFPERRPAPAPAPSASAMPEDPDSLPAEPLPKKIRVGASRTGPSRAAVPDLGVAPPQAAPGHARVVSGPARIVMHTSRDAAPDAAKYGPMRAAVPSTSTGSAPVTRSVSSSGPSRMRIDPPPPPPSISAPINVDPLASSHPQPPNGPSRRFRPNRVPMDPSQMPQRVAVLPPVQKPAAEPKKLDGPSRVNLGSSAKTTTAAAPMGPPTRVVSTAKPERELKASSNAPAPPASVDEAPQPAVGASVLALPPTAPEPTSPVAPVPVVVLAPSPTSIPIPATAPVSRPASTTPSDSRPASVASTMTSMAPSTSASVSARLASASAPALVKPPLISSKPASISSKVSALIKRGNPNAPPPFVPKRTGAAAGGVGAGTASQMTRQREAIAAREKRETEEAAKKAKWDAMQKKGTKGKETKETQSKEKADKPADPPAPAKVSRPKREDPQPTKTLKSVPAAPRKAATLNKTKSHTALPKVNVKELEPEMVAPITVPLPGSPTPLVAEEVLLPPAETTTAVAEKIDSENMVLDALDDAMVLEPAAPEPAMEIEQETEPEAEELAADDAPMSDSTAESGNDADQDEDMVDEANQTVVAADNEEPVQTPPRTTPVSLIDQTPASTPAPAAPSGFAFHPQLAQLMAMPPQPVEEVDDFLVDLASPLPKERPVEKEGASRYALGDMGNTNVYLSQFTQDMMMLSGL